MPIGSRCHSNAPPNKQGPDHGSRLPWRRIVPELLVASVPGKDILDALDIDYFSPTRDWGFLDSVSHPVSCKPLRFFMLGGTAPTAFAIELCVF